MDLKWWALTLVGFVCLATVIAVALLWRQPRVHRVLRPLAHVDRLTRLPEYIRVERIQLLSAVLTGLLLLVVFCSALITSSRPVGLTSATRNFESVHPEDIMLCVGQPITEPSTAGLLNHFAEQTATFDTQRIGLTSPSLRVIPMTRDYDYAADRLRRFARVAGLQQDLTDDKQLSDTDTAALRSGITEFSRGVDYLDYARSVEDILALCLTGFPSFDDKSTHRRSIIYLGYSALRAPDEQRPSLFSAQDVTDMAARAGVQVNVVARSDVLQWSEDGDQALRAIAESTGGRFFPYNPEGGAEPGGTDPMLAADLDRIRAAPPGAVLPNGVVVTSRSWDYPNVPLIVSLLGAVLLCVALAVLRR